MWRVFLAASAMLTCHTARGDETDDATSYWVPFATAHMAACEVFPREDPERQFRMLPDPVFHHVQSVRGRSVGSVFLWVDEADRPVAVGDAFFFGTRPRLKMYNEWHSLASVPITVKSERRIMISPVEAGVTWSEIPDAPQPAASSAVRRRQIRVASQRFAAHLIDRRDDRYELRLLPTPLYRFDSPESEEAVAGAFFAFCQETDPELFLLIEARRTNDGPMWMYAAAEFSNLNLYLRIDDVEVWRAAPPRFNSGGPHWGGPLKDVAIPVSEATDEPSTGDVN